MAPDSFADVPQDLRKEIERLEQLFSIDTAKLKEITHHFVNELEKGGSLSTPPLPNHPPLSWVFVFRLTRDAGLSVEGGSIVRAPFLAAPCESCR